MEQAGLCSTCVPPGAGKTRRGGTPASPCPVSKIGGCSTWTTKKQHTPASARHSPVVAPCGLFPGGAGTYPVRAVEAPSERVTGKRKRTVPVILNEVKNPFSPLRVNRDGTGIRILQLRCAPLRMTALKGLRGTAAHDVRRCRRRSLFLSACAICTLSQDTAPTGRGIRKQDKGRVLTPAPATPDGRADRENGSFPRLSASACWICTKGTILSSYTAEV